MKIILGREISLWWLVTRSWTFVGCVLVGLALRTVGPARPHVVPEPVVWQLLTGGWALALVLTFIAASRDLLGRAPSPNRCGTLGLWFLSVGLGLLSLSNISPRVLNSAMGEVILYHSILLLAGASLAGISGLMIDKQKARAATSLLGIVVVTGFTIPVFSNNIGEPQRAKALQDLDLLRNAVTLHDSQNRPLTGTSLRALGERYLRDLPHDPWGGEYLLDSSVGILVSFAADLKPGGTGEGEDIVVRYKSRLTIRLAHLAGGWGPPRRGFLLKLVFTQPFLLRGDPLDDLSVMMSPKEGGRGATLSGSQATPGLGWGNAIWEHRGAVDGTREEDGILVIRCREGDPVCPIVLSPMCVVNLGEPGPTFLDSERKARHIFERCSSGGPLDGTTYGSSVMAAQPAVALEPLGRENRGVPLAPESRTR